MKITILITALAILAFNMNTHYKKDIQSTPTYIQTIALKNQVSIGSFVPVEDTFVSHAIKGNRQEILMAQMVLQKSTNAQIKSFAQHLINGHQQLLQELQKLKNTGNQADNMDSVTTESMPNMAYNNLSGNDFDRKWVSDMIIGHTKTMNEFKTDLGTTQDANVRNVITQALPTISKHLRQLEALRNKMM